MKKTSLDHWFLLATACGAPEITVAADRQRMTDLIWSYPAEEEQL